MLRCPLSNLEIAGVPFAVESPPWPQPNVSSEKPSVGQAVAFQEPPKSHSPSFSSCSDMPPMQSAWDLFIVFPVHKQPRQRKCLFLPGSRSEPHARHTVSRRSGHCEPLRVPLFPPSPSPPRICWKQPYMVKKKEKTAPRSSRAAASGRHPPALPAIQEWQPVV